MELILNLLSRITGVPGITLSAMRKTLFACSCICDYIQKVVCCPACGKWQLTNRVFCQKCSADGTHLTDWQSIRLIECKGIHCGGNPEISSKYCVEKKKKAVCQHKSKKYLCRYILYVPLEAVITEYIRSRLFQEMICLKESDICDAAQQADSLGYHSVFLSRNAAIAYHNNKWEDAERAVLKHLEMNESVNPHETLSDAIEEAKRIHHPFSGLLLT